jgi:C1A family cysteine protease
MMSAQQLVDCDKSNFGCSGGWPWVAIKWLTEHGGLESEADYPQNDNYHVTCNFDLPKVVARPKGYMNISRDEEQLRRAVFELGPISIGLDFSELQFYRRGVANPRFCSDYPDHALLLVGFGEEHGEPFWLVKNSWGERWGEQGYFRLARGKDRCGIKDWACTALLH